MSRRGLAVLVAAALAVPSLARAGEGYPERTAGGTVIWDGYGVGHGETYVAPVIPFTMNLMVDDPDWRTTTDEEKQLIAFRGAIVAVQAMGYWENVPTARLELDLEDVAMVAEPWTVQDGRNLITLGWGDPLLAAGTRPFLDDPDGVAEIVEADIAVAPSFFYPDAPTTELERGRAVLTHELGHALGFNHSPLGDRGVRADGALVAGLSVRSIMNEKGTTPAAGMLGADDIALVSRLYPDHFNRLARTTGSVRARVLDTTGTSDIYGATVYLVDPASGRVVVSGLSGWQYIAPAPGADDGRVELEGAPPGTYDVYVTRTRATQCNPDCTKIGMVELTATGSQTYPTVNTWFDTPAGWGRVRGVPVAAGEVVDVGYLRFGADRTFAAPDLIDATATTTPGDAWYSFVFYPDGSSTSMYSTLPLRVPYVELRVTPGVYRVKALGYNGSAWVEKSSTLIDYRAARISLPWPRKLAAVGGAAGGAQAEAVSYHLTLGRVGSALPPKLDGAAMDGNRYTTHVVPGSYLWRVGALFDPNPPGVPGALTVTEVVTARPLVVP